MFLIVKPKKLAALAAVLLAAALFLGTARQLTEVAAFTQGTRVPIVMYHHVSVRPQALGKYVISPAELEADLIWLREHNYTTLTISDLVQYQAEGLPLPERCIVLTFDDGQESFYAYVYPLLQAYDACAVVSVVGEFVDRYSNEEDHNLNYSCLTWTQLAEMADSGFVEIGNHTYSMHSANGTRRGSLRLAGENDADYAATLSADVDRLQTLLEEHTGQRASTFAYPFGMVSPESRAILTGLGFRALLTCEAYVNDSADPDWLLRLGRFNRPSGIDSAAFFENTLGLD